VKTKEDHFKLITVSEGKVALRAHDGRFCSGNGSPIQCSQTDTNGWTQFEQIKNEDGSFSFKCINHNYVSVSNTRALKCESDKMSDAAKFYIKAE
jgi:hypothetical protein